MEEVRQLCKRADIVALQETWLCPHDLPLLNTVDKDFGCTGISAIDTSSGPLIGRPYGGVALSVSYQSIVYLPLTGVKFVHMVLNH